MSHIHTDKNAAVLFSIKFLLFRMRILGVWSLEVRGNLKVEPGKQYVIVANHSSYLDHAAMSFLPWPKKYLTNNKYFILPVFGWIQWLVGDIGVNVSSKENRAQSLQKCVDVLKKGSSIVIYPEGTRSKIPKQLLPFKHGAFTIAKEAGVPILPVTLVNVQKGREPKKHVTVEQI